MNAYADLTERGDRIVVRFPYDPSAVNAIKSIPGRKFVPKEKGGPHWTLPLDLVSARSLRAVFGTGLELGNAIKTWGRASVEKERNLRALGSLDDVPLEELKLTQKLPELAQWLRPYQRADVKFLATTNTLNGNQPRLGKTAEIIGAVFEADLENGPQLVVAPRTSLETIWRYEIERWTGHHVYTFSGDVPKRDRAFIFDSIDEHMHRGEPFWFVTTPDMVRRGNQPSLEWNTLTIDEFHKTGLSEIKNVFPKAVNKVKAKRKFAMSGTPMGGKPIKLWGALHFLEPNVYTSKWNWADTWLQIDEIYVGANKYKEIGGIKKEKEDAFYASLAPHMIRRLRTEVLPQLPEKQYIEVWCEMLPEQRKQYETFEADAEIRIDEEHLSATSVLAEYTRLKQFSNAECNLVEERGEIKLMPVQSGKLDYLFNNLAEAGIDPEDLAASDAQAIVASQFKSYANWVYAELMRREIPCALISGDVKGAERDRIVREAQQKIGARVIVMVTTAGGVAITLDQVETVHILDETWNPDDQEQLADRALNTTENHQVTVLTYRSRGTIEEKIHRVAFGKAVTNKNILDLRRQIFRAAAQAAA